MHKIDDCYYEILIQPYGYYEIFLDFIANNIEECLEEVRTPYFLSHQNEDISKLDLACFFKEQERQNHQIVIRTLKNAKEVIEMLVEFDGVLVQRVGECVGFGCGYQKCKNQDWIEAYRQSILPVKVGGFYIRPTWHKSAKEEGLNLKDMMIDPALAFGSGHHATTSMCLEFLEEINLANTTLLDVGCGSGILSIGASMLGAKVEICDTDSFAIEESLKNFKLNSQEITQYWVGSIPQACKEYDCIVANILAHILIILEPDFYSHLRLGGTLILSGILEDYKEQVLNRFRRFEVEEIKQKQEWVSLKLAKVK